MSTAPVLIMAGGTGGHIFPALAVARALRRRNQPVVWLGTQHGMESRIVPREGIALETVRISGLRRKGLLAWVLAPLQLASAVIDAIGILRRLKPRAVLGMGGFASGPGGIAAWLLGRPLIIHEQNAIAGLTNRLLAGIAREVLEAFPGSFSSRVKTRLIGNPVRDEIVALPDPRARLAGRSGRLRLLVLGGSQGARVLNEVVPQAVALLADEQRPEIWHQAGPATIEVARQCYAQAGVTARAEPFIDDMAAAYAWADMAICRAGALTISELAAAGLSAVLVPFPGAVDDHQRHNAGYLVGAGAAVLIDQSQLTAQRLAAEISRAAGDRNLVVERAVRARSIARPRATEDLAELCLIAGAAA
jgi:UDP-N-acetylglucosamine--N-acetylmuramyl-(pentapeptide) pyrophosphoryl-undecaprenol N-acetylglucosamine transferase